MKGFHFEQKLSMGDDTPAAFYRCVCQCPKQRHPSSTVAQCQLIHAESVLCCNASWGFEFNK